MLVASPALAAGTAAPAATASFNEVMGSAMRRALGGGISGAIAGVIQVLTLMWLRTTMNYQYRYGTGTREAMAALYKQGGIGRFYQGLPYAIFQAPLSRFGDTAANSGVLALLSMTTLPIALRTACASAAGSLWRIAITPLDTLKTTLQVQGSDAYDQVMAKVKSEGVGVLYQGALANALASFVGSYPWYLTFNALNEAVPLAPAGMIALKLFRNAMLGFGATCVSDCISNSIRVLKTTRQTSPTTITYREAAQQVIDKDGVKGLFGRGLGTRLMTNGVQASMFAVVWKLIEEQLNNAGFK
jgi:ribosomal protein S5